MIDTLPAAVPFDLRSRYGRYEKARVQLTEYVLHEDIIYTIVLF